MAPGSGAARGWAHIGILRALAEQGIAPDFVAGCSMGAMVGAAYAAGHIEQLGRRPCQPLGPFEYHRAALAIAKGRESVALMLPAIHASLA
ncbi:MAG: patatin-like phospholipase family protein [Methylocella sp.]